MFKKYNEEQFTTVKLPGGSQEVGRAESLMTLKIDINMESQVLLSPYNGLEDERYYDAESQTSFVVDHTTQVLLSRRSAPARPAG